MRPIPLEQLNTYLAVQKKVVVLNEAKKKWKSCYDIAFQKYCEAMEVKMWAESKDFQLIRSLLVFFGLAESKAARVQRSNHLFNLALNCVLSSAPMYELAYKEVYGSTEGYKPVAQQTRTQYITEFAERKTTETVSGMFQRIEELMAERELVS